MLRKSSLLIDSRLGTLAECGTFWCWRQRPPISAKVTIVELPTPSPRHSHHTNHHMLKIAQESSPELDSIQSSVGISGEAFIRFACCSPALESSAAFAHHLGNFDSYCAQLGRTRHPVYLEVLLEDIKFLSTVLLASLCGMSLSLILLCWLCGVGDKQTFRQPRHTDSGIANRVTPPYYDLKNSRLVPIGLPLSVAALPHCLPPQSRAAQHPT
jgi:hypothetical protein